MGARPAMPKTYASQMGRSQRGVGPGVVPHLSRVSGQRIPKPSSYRPPRDIGQEKSQTWIDLTFTPAGASARYVLHSIDVPTGETWSIGLAAEISGGTWTSAYVSGQTTSGAYTSSGAQPFGALYASPVVVTGPATFQIHTETQGTTVDPASMTTTVRWVRIA